MAFVVWCTLGAVPSVVFAAPMRGEGRADSTETKKPSASRTRARALRRARAAALKAAVGQVEGPIDPAARKAVFAAADVWTGAYRILSERHEGEAIVLEVEAEIDTVRLAKRLAPRNASSGRSVFRLGDVGSAESCGAPEAVTTLVGEELSAQAGLVLDAKGETVDVALDCQVLGPVQHTYLHAARVRVVVSAEGRTVAERVVPAFATTPEQAVVAGLHRGLGEVAEALTSHRKGTVRLRVQGPWPTERVRRFETVVRNSVAGVDAVAVSTIERGVVELRVRGRLDAKTLSRRLGTLSFPGFAVSIIDVESPDVLTIRLQ